MLYTEDENKRWWDGLGRTAQFELFDRIIANAQPGVRKWAESLVEIWERGTPLSNKNLASLRKWDR